MFRTFGEPLCLEASHHLRTCLSLIIHMQLVTTCSEGDHYLVQVVCVALLGVYNQSMALVVDGHHGLVCVIECEKTSSFSPTAAEDSKAGVWK